MIPAVVVGLVAIAVLAAQHASSTRQNDQLADLLREERERTGDLLTRLAARSPGEYASVQRQQAIEATTPKPAVRYGVGPGGFRSLIEDTES